jgi:tryptophanyl-tRNA synthetase
MACGLDPEKNTLYVQSHVKEHASLAWILNCFTMFGELSRMTQFKDKSTKHADNVNAGLFTYPTLMAADILIHKAVKVPVGKDQEQNMEMARKFARRFNNIYGVEYFPEPQSYSLAGKGIKIPGLDGSGKMGKSEGNCIYLIDEPSVIRKKVMKAVTDSGPTEPNSEKPEVIQNLFTLLEVASTPDTYNYFNEKWNDCSIRYGDLKKQLAEDIINKIAPIRERIVEFSSNTELLKKIAREGAEKARASAVKTISEVQQIIGFTNI